MQPVPYLFFNGTCREAMTTYAALFGSGEPTIMGYGDAPPDAGMPEGMGDAVMHAAVRVGEGWIYGSDDMPGRHVEMTGSDVMLSFPSVKEARKVFDALAEGGEVKMPFEAQFWSPGFGNVRDRFGIRWMIAVDDPEGE